MPSPTGWTPPGTVTPLPRWADVVGFAVMLAGGVAVLALVDAVSAWVLGR